MTKKYINVELQVVRMNNRDIVTESLRVGKDIDATEGEIQAGSAGRRFEDWDAGY